MRETYSKLNRVCSTGHNTSEKNRWIQTSRQYQEGTLAVVEMTKTIRAGRALYRLDMWERVELDEGIPKVEMHGDSLDNESLERARAAVLANAKPVVPVTPTSEPESNEGAEFEPLFRALELCFYLGRFELECHFREQAKDITSSITDPMASGLCRAVIDENLQQIEDILKRINLADSGEPLEVSTSFQAMHFATFTTNPVIISALMFKDLDPLVKTIE